MMYLFGFVLLLLTGAVVVLFAMLGELSSRVTPGSGGSPEDVRPLLDVPVGRAPERWPGPLAELAGAEQAVALVLSTACTSCAKVAGQLRDQPELVAGQHIGVVISTADRQRGDEFVAQHGLARLPSYVDEQGEWVVREFGINTSPSALVFQRGRLVSAFVFTDAAALRAAAHPAKEAV